MESGTHFDALLPREIAHKAEDIGVSKAHLDFLSTLLLSMLAGAFIALGAAFSTTAVSGAEGVLPYGLIRILAGVTFSLGLILVVVAGAELFTGNNLLLMAFASRKISLHHIVRNWVIVYLGNFVGSVATALGLYLAGFHTMGGGAVGRTALAIAHAKCQIGWHEAFVRGVYCNALVCLAVWVCMSCRSTGDRVLAILFPITAFVAAGFEHSIANMYFIPAAIFVKQWAGDAFWTSIVSAPAAYPSLTWTGLWSNLLPVTLGNILGGGVLVGAVYWVVYGRHRDR